MSHYKLFFDGSCGPKNPGGTAAYGFAILKDGEAEPIATGKGIIGTGPAMSNNLAEFSGLYEGLATFMQNHWNQSRETVSVFGDSNLVIQVMSGHWTPQPIRLYYPAYKLCDGIVRHMRKNGITVLFDHVPREQNDLCDRLSKAR